MVWLRHCEAAVGGHFSNISNDWIFSITSARCYEHCPRSVLDHGELWWLHLREEPEEAESELHIHGHDDLLELGGLVEACLTEPESLDDRVGEELLEVLEARL